MTFGFHGKILVINLNDQTIEEKSFPEKIYRQFYGGYGLGVYYIYNNIVPGTDPLGPGNIIGFLPGLLTGSVAPMTGRYVVCAKSPLTGKGKTANGKDCSGGWGNANSGGFFGPAIIKAGFDGIFFTGIADEPIYLLIDGDTISLEDASSLWGKDAVETEKHLKEKHGKRFQVSTIGQAGENQSLISGIVTDGGRIAARSGLGAVMGSKKLKALCLKGNKRITYKDKDKMIELSRAYNNKIKKYRKIPLATKNIHLIDHIAPIVKLFGLAMKTSGPMHERLAVAGFGGAKLGTPTMNVIFSQLGLSPIKNFKGTPKNDYPKKKAMQLRGKKLRSYVTKQYGCYGCSVRCGAIIEHPELPHEDKESHRPEFETCAAFGPLLVNDDLDSIIQINDYLNRAGMDTMSAGSVIAYIMECVENNLLKKKDFCCQEFPDGFLPTWGDAESILPLLKLMVTREGIGDILADGTKEAAKKITNSKQYAMNANGQEIPYHDPRQDFGLAVTYLTDPTPGRHTAGTIGSEKTPPFERFIKNLSFETSKDPYENGVYSAKAVKLHQTMEAMGLCFFVFNQGEYPFLPMIQAAFGWKISIEELLATGHRIQTLRQMFNAREGAIRHEISQRVIGSPPMEKGPVKDISLDLETMARGYYEGMGFADNGMPMKETLEELSLDFCIGDLQNCTGVPEPLVNKFLEEENEKPYHPKLKYKE